MNLVGRDAGRGTPPECGGQVRVVKGRRNRERLQEHYRQFLDNAIPLERSLDVLRGFDLTASSAPSL